MPHASKKELTDTIAGEMHRAIARAVLVNDRIARHLGVGVVDLQVISTLMLSESPLTAGVISAQTELPTSTTTRVIDRLEAEGLVSRSVDPEDRRRVVVALLPEARRRMDEPLQRIHELIGEVDAGYSVAELDAALRYMQQLVEISERL